MLEPDLTKNNCSIIMKDIKAEDENEYAFRVEGQKTYKNTFNPTVKIIIQDEPIMDVPRLSDGVEASLTCSAPFPCPETPPEIKWWIKTREGNILSYKDDNITPITSTSLNLSTLTLTPTSELHSATVGCDVSYGDKSISTSRTLEVMYVHTLQILGDDRVREGDTLGLICTVESHPPSSDPVWSFNGSTDTIRKHTSAENLTITNVGEEHAGIYVCEMTYRNETLKASITISVIRHGNKDWSITFNPPEVTAVPGLCALISCTFTYPDNINIKNVQWKVFDENGENEIFKRKVSEKNKDKLEEKETETERIKMLEPDLTKNNCSIIMKDIKAEDENEYAFRVEGQKTHRYTYTPRVKITIQDNAKPIDNVQWKVFDENGENEIFKRKVSEKNKDKLEEKETETERIKMLEPDLTKNNCSIIMKDIKAEDENEYAFRVEGQKTHRYTYTPRVKITIQDEPKIDVPPLSDGVEANLTCSAPFPCPETPPEITWWIKTRGGNTINPEDDNITLITSTSLNLSTLTLTPSSELHSATVGCDVSYGDKNISTSRTLEMYTLQILGDDTVREGDTLSLICTVESHPPSSDPVWSFNGSTDTIRNHTSAENLTITNVREEHAGRYVCEMTYRNKTLNASITISIIRKEAFQMQVDIRMITGFLTGISVSAVIFSVVLCCHESWQRGKKHKVLTENPDIDINLETVQTDVAQSGTNEQTPLHGELNGGTLNTGAPTDGAEEDEAVEMQAREADYASIDYSLLKNRPPEEVEREPTDTDYAEVKREKIGDGKQREALQDGDDQTETPDQKQMEGEEELYSNSQVLKSQGAKES
ncbi:Sialic acid-binding Ig-like lectin 12 [Anabarilius grahami]|uniref:Sialic acid-binding Ig-like lectin 12 n=1 Tax=Anabarilius grahami TaxID=495550 RepID=A0A3N0XD43_ANAGA|nr:Sialic acid-binding Ig-like lectin 12 [Anabarilius grahami]